MAETPVSAFPGEAVQAVVLLTHAASCSSTEFCLLFLYIQLAWGNKWKKKPEPVAQLIRGFQAELVLPDLQWIWGLSVETEGKGKSEQASYSYFPMEAEKLSRT